MQPTVINFNTFSSDEESSDLTRSSFKEKEKDYNAEDEKLTGDITKGVANLIWDESRQRARKAFNTYTNIDILRPYFDVEPRIVKERLISSLLPIQLYRVDESRIPQELYGPNMIVLSLVAMLLMQMKAANVALKEGTLMGSALGLCFGYWMLSSFVLWLLCYLFNIRLKIIQALHLQGYGLFGPCVVIFITTIIHPHSSHLFFYIVALLFIILSTTKMASILINRVSNQRSLTILITIIFCLQLFFLFYIHFSYHQETEEIVPNFYTKDRNIFEKSFALNKESIMEYDKSERNTSLTEEKLIVSPLNKIRQKLNNHNIRHNTTRRLINI